MPAGALLKMSFCNNTWDVGYELYVYDYLDFEVQN
jgi:hypothetical protein